MDPFSIGLTGLSFGLQAFGMFGRKQRSNPQLDFLSTFAEIRQSELRRQQMNLDATRRKRDIIRQAQVATARSESTAFSQGAGQSSVVEGARGTISGEAGSQYLGVSQNQQIGNEMFDLANIKAMINFQQSKEQGKTSFSDKLSNFGSTIAKNEDTISRLAKFGFSKFTEGFSFV